MLRPLGEAEFDKYVDLAYGLALDTERSGYPTYTDGIKTKQDFVERSRKAFSRDNEQILLYERNGITEGWIHYYVLPDDSYADTCSFCIAEGMGDAVKEFTDHMTERYPGFDLYMGFPKENIDAVSALRDLGAELIEESYNNAIELEGYEPGPEDDDIIPVTRDNYPLFSELHSVHTDMYWNTERILEDLDEWRIFVRMKDGRPVGAVYFMIWDDLVMDEIFGIDLKDDIYDGEVFRSLMNAALAYDKRRGVRHMVFFSEEGSQQDAIACGYRCIGKYVCYKKRLE